MYFRFFMILNTAIILVIGYAAYLILTITRGRARKKKRALANLKKLYQLYNSRNRE